SGPGRRAAWDALGSATAGTGAADGHCRAVLHHVEVERIRGHAIAVFLDANGGAGGPLGQALLQALGCRLTAHACDPGGHFRHEPEPAPAHLGDVARLVKASGGATGRVLAPDAHRLALI